MVEDIPVTTNDVSDYINLFVRIAHIICNHTISCFILLLFKAGNFVCVCSRLCICVRWCIYRPICVCMYTYVYAFLMTLARQSNKTAILRRRIV